MNDINQHFDVVIIGGGIDGSAFLWTIASHDLSILLLEKSFEHKDVVRGESLPIWGVRESIPAELYSDAFTEQIVGQLIWSDLPCGCH